MAINFKDTAKRVSNNDHFIINGRTRIQINDIISNYPDGITITSFDIFKDRNAGTYPVIGFLEDDSKFAMGGGKMFTDIISGWYDECNGNAQAGSEDLKAQGGVKIKFSKRTSQRGFEYIYPEVVE